jgi:hypothetical protein
MSTTRNLDEAVSDETEIELAGSITVPAADATENKIKGLGQMTSAELAQAFGDIPPTTMTSAELAQAFAAIPPTVTALDLPGDDLGLRTGTEGLAKITSAEGAGALTAAIRSGRCPEGLKIDLGGPVDAEGERVTSEGEPAGSTISASATEVAPATAQPPSLKGPSSSTSSFSK